MVTKHYRQILSQGCRSVLAKILMVTKLEVLYIVNLIGSVLAKILMVTKHKEVSYDGFEGSVLAKILMVTKQVFLFFF